MKILGTSEEVLSGKADFAVVAKNCMEFLDFCIQNNIRLSCMFGSPPYPLLGKRYVDISEEDSLPWNSIESWIDTTELVTEKAVQITSGPVFWVVHCPYKNSNYLPAVEGLIWRWYTSGKSQQRPCLPFTWEKNSPPTKINYFSNTYETILCFKNPGDLPTYNWKEVAEPPKYKSGGHFRQRDKTGKRKKGSDYPQNPLTRPRDIIKIPVGGGLMGSKLACSNEAPFPLALANYFVKVFTKPSDIVGDVFLGSGTTCHSALSLGRKFIGCDIRQSQVDLTIKRISEELP